MHKARLTRRGPGTCEFWLQLIGACLSRLRKAVIVAAARMMRLLMSAWLCPSYVWRLPRYTKLATDSTSLPLMYIFSGGRPAPRFCNTVLAHNTWRTAGTVASLKLNRRGAAAPACGRSTAVSSAYTRSVKSELRTTMPGACCMWVKIPTMAMQNKTGARMQPCLTLDVVQKRR